MTLWTGGLLSAFVVLGIAMILITSRLEKMTERIFMDASGLETAHALETAILAERRTDRLLREGGSPALQAERSYWLGQQDREIPRLNDTVTSSEERHAVEEIMAAYAPYRTQVGRAGTPLSTLTPVVDRLLAELARYRQINQAQMAATARASSKLNRSVDLSVSLLLLIITAVGVTGVAALWRRIFRPVLDLTRAAAEFGAGALARRVPVRQQDEFGELCRTFNAMADEIVDREQERLTFLAAVAHDLRGPLQIISGQVYLLRRQLDEQASARPMDRIARQVGLLDAMLTDLMDTVQVYTGKLALNDEDGDLAALCREIAEVQGDSAGRAIQVDAPLTYPARGDARRLERVLWNLISNAIKYSAPDTSIRVEVERSPEGPRIRIHDQGAGISPEEMAVLFRPFGRLGRTSRMAGGTGLGLYSAKRIIEAHKGTLAIRGAPGGGTSVEIRLPAPACGGAGQAG